MDRRVFLEWMVATGGLATFDRLGASDLRALGREAHLRSQDPRGKSIAPVLDARAAALVTIAAERIIPATATPGATQAGVTAFVETMLAGWYPPADRERFLTGLAELDVRSRARTSTDFVAATEGDQVAILETLDAEVTALRATNAAAANAHWFGMLKYLTVWGYCTSDVGMRETLHNWPQAMRYDGNAMVAR